MKNRILGKKSKIFLRKKIWKKNILEIFFSLFSRGGGGVFAKFRYRTISKRDSSLFLNLALNFDQNVIKHFLVIILGICVGRHFFFVIGHFQAGKIGGLKKQQQKNRVFSPIFSKNDQHLTDLKNFLYVINPQNKCQKRF